jgi:hypothetical protein
LKNQLQALYLEPNRNTVQKPVEGLPVLALFSTKKQEGKGAKKTIAAYHANVRSMFQSLHEELQSLQSTKSKTEK